MGKVVKFTGSRLLGEELRRLRAGRTLDDVVELGKTKLVPSGFRYVGKGTLSDIENGKVLPNLESVFALSVLYQVPASRFLHFLLEENVVEGIAAPETEEELLAAFTDAVKFRRWSEALALAVHGVKRNPTGWPQIRWRLNRATAMEKLGMRQDAIIEVNACLEETDFPSSERFKLHRELARMHADGGQLRLAELHVEECLRLMPADSPAEVRVKILETRIMLVLQSASRNRSWDSRNSLDEVSEWLREAQFLARSQSSVGDVLALELYTAVLERLRGKGKDARRDLKRILVAARESSMPLREAEALMELGVLEVEANVELARRHFAAAAEIAVNSGFIDLAFHSLMQLHAIAESASQQAYYFRKAQKLYPFVASCGPEVRRFESLRLQEMQ